MFSQLDSLMCCLKIACLKIKKIPWSAWNLALAPSSPSCIRNQWDVAIRISGMFSDGSYSHFLADSTDSPLISPHFLGPKVLPARIEISHFLFRFRQDFWGGESIRLSLLLPISRSWRDLIVMENHRKP